MDKLNEKSFDSEKGFNLKHGQPTLKKLLEKD